MPKSSASIEAGRRTVPNTSPKSLAYCRATRSRSAARAITSAAGASALSATSCSRRVSKSAGHGEADGLVHVLASRSSLRREVEGSGLAKSTRPPHRDALLRSGRGGGSVSLPRTSRRAGRGEGAEQRLMPRISLLRTVLQTTPRVRGHDGEHRPDRFQWAMPIGPSTCLSDRARRPPLSRKSAIRQHRRSRRSDARCPACGRSLPKAGGLVRDESDLGHTLQRSRPRTIAVGDVHRPSPGPAPRQPGTALTSMTYHSPSGPGSRSTPATGRADRRRRLQRQRCLRVRVSVHGLRRAALRDVGPPVVAGDAAASPPAPGRRARTPAGPSRDAG